MTTATTFPTPPPLHEKKWHWFRCVYVHFCRTKIWKFLFIVCYLSRRSDREGFAYQFRAQKDACGKIGFCLNLQALPVPSFSQIRLKGGLNSYEGRVEVFHGGRWGTICADNWRIEEAMVVCRQLNLGYGSHAITQNYFGATNLGVIMSGVICRVDEISIYNCQHDPWQNATCSKSNKLAGVICVDGKVE